MSALLISSLNTPARMLVNSKGNDEANFLQNMNSSVLSLGLPKTKFSDTYGISDKNVTTAKEYQTLFSHVVKNNTMQEYLGASGYEYTELVDNDDMPDHFDIHTNKLMKESDLPYTIIASKTGFTYDAGSCLVMLVKRDSDGKKFVILTMGNPDFGKNTRLNAPAELANWSMDNF